LVKGKSGLVKADKVLDDEIDIDGGDVVNEGERVLMQGSGEVEEDGMTLEDGMTPDRLTSFLDEESKALITGKLVGSN
jgi:hypothetical protein